MSSSADATADVAGHWHQPLGLSLGAHAVCYTNLGAFCSGDTAIFHGSSVMTKLCKLRRPVRFAIFDLDGVLLDTEPLYTQATQQVVAPFGKIFDWSIKGDIIGRDARDGALRVVEALDLPISPQEYLARREPLLRILFEQAMPRPGARELVAALQARGVAMAVATSSDSELCAIKIARHHWFTSFRAVVCGDDPRISALKPAPDIFLIAAEELAAQPADCVVFEDSPAGVEAARRAGMQVVALPDRALSSARVADADIVLQGFEELCVEQLGL